MSTTTPAAATAPATATADAKDAEIRDLQAQVHELRTQLVAMKGGKGVRSYVRP